LPDQAQTSIDYSLNRALPDDIPSIIRAHLASNELFRTTGLLPEAELATHVPEDIIAEAIRAGFAFVVREVPGEAVGFALSRPVEDTLYLDQVSVDPQHGQRGIGRALVERTLDEARTLGFRSVALSTFRELPWNGPFYRSMGFREIPRRRMTDWMKELEAAQAMTMDVSKRCFMRMRTRRGLL
jgi:GNAT superfamily N-acetyltransferase